MNREESIHTPEDTMSIEREEGVLEQLSFLEHIIQQIKNGTYTVMDAVPGLELAHRTLSLMLAGKIPEPS